MSRRNERPMHRVRFVNALFSTAIAVIAFGCHSPSSFRVTSYKDPYFPETYAVQFSPAAYRVGPDGDVHIAGKSATASRDRGDIRQWIYVHGFWRPRPGKTFANSTATDCTLRYVIASPGGTAVYEGTGFIYPLKPTNGQALVARMESASLRLVRKIGEPSEILGDSRLVGDFQAAPDAAQAVDLQREAEIRAARAVAAN